MPVKPTKSGSDLFIVDNSDVDWKVLQYLKEWTSISHTFDIATGYFEIGSLLAMNDDWQKLDKIRILMGDEVSKRTKKALIESLQGSVQKLDASIEKEKEQNDFLIGVPAIVEALRNGKIQCRVYTKKKFHAKAYITHSKLAVVGSSALVGSSNFTYPGLTENIELNVQLRREVEELQEWFDRHWNEADEVSEDILRTIERHTHEYLPFDVYAKAMQEFFKGHEISESEWELTQSRMYPILDQYQKHGYRSLKKIAQQFGGAFLCDGVGLGKTFIGLMVIEHLIMHDRKRVALFVPKSGRKSVWEFNIKKYLPHLYGDFSNLVVFNHTDLGREGEFPERFKKITDLADVIMIDEAHHFRNPGIFGLGAKRPSRYWKMYELTNNKQVFLLTATPINNKLIDLQHMIELFTHRRQDYFKEAPLGIHSLQGHIRSMENALDKIIAGKDNDQNESGIDTNLHEAQQVLSNDALFRSLVVQRSRAYVKESQRQQGKEQALFPERREPQVAKYSLKKTYGPLLQMIEKAFAKNKPLFSLAAYYPLAYLRTEVTNQTKAEVKDTKSFESRSFEEGRQKQVVGLIKILFLKRFESSPRAFERSCQELLLKLLAFVQKHSITPGEIKRLDRWKAQHDDLLVYVKHLRNEENVTDDDDEEDVVSEELLEKIEELDREQYEVGEIISETMLDLDQLVKFLNELRKYDANQDDKLQSLISLLTTDPVLQKHKVIIFSEYLTTARYINNELRKAGMTEIDEVDSVASTDKREDIIKQFAPYYNDSSSAQLKNEGLRETRILISTDVLSEGLNLQDATRLINYDIHWNPVRLMQRIGRIDRRYNPDIEKRILQDHPSHAEIRGKIAYWNFLPPYELNLLLTLYRNVSHKTLRISKTFGIEGKKLLRPEDDFDALKEFNQSYEGTPSEVEAMDLEYQKLLSDNPGLAEHLSSLPGRIFSGKHHNETDARAVFLCYNLPAPDRLKVSKDDTANIDWTEEAGYTKWYLYDVLKEKICEEPSEILEVIRCTPDTERYTTIERSTLVDIRKKIEKHIKNTYFKSVQAPQGVKPLLKCWMEISS